MLYLKWNGKSCFLRVFFLKYGLELIDAVGMGIAFFEISLQHAGWVHTLLLKQKEKCKLPSGVQQVKVGEEQNRVNVECYVIFFPASSAVVLFSRAGDWLFLLSRLRERHL